MPEGCRPTWTPGADLARVHLQRWCPAAPWWAATAALARGLGPGERGRGRPGLARVKQTGHLRRSRCVARRTAGGVASTLRPSAPAPRRARSNAAGQAKPRATGTARGLSGLPAGRQGTLRAHSRGLCAPEGPTRPSGAIRDRSHSTPSPCIPALILQRPCPPLLVLSSPLQFLPSHIFSTAVWLTRSTHNLHKDGVRRFRVGWQGLNFFQMFKYIDIQTKNYIT